jgi:DNA-binding response OmpR family regulator
VENDVIVRMVLALYLRECGYRVLEAGNSDEAIALLSLPDFAIDVVLADVNINGSAGGFGLSQWVRREKPQVKMVLTSGISSSADAAASLCDQGPHMRRPYQPQEVERRIRELLARSDK